ncbi:transposase [Arthrobacter sp. M4]|uniref:transposase n=1 Tax=Arthrobacter sp. M4 TaxID=218160 RepID=UPI0035ABE15C
MADLWLQMRQAGVDYPKKFGQFQDWFSTDYACVEYLAGLRWPEGFVCPKCGSRAGEVRPARRRPRLHDPHRRGAAAAPLAGEGPRHPP